MIMITVLAYALLGTVIIIIRYEKKMPNKLDRFAIKCFAILSIITIITDLIRFFKSA